MATISEPRSSIVLPPSRPASYQETVLFLLLSLSFLKRQFKSFIFQFTSVTWGKSPRRVKNQPHLLHGTYRRHHYPAGIGAHPESSILGSRFSFDKGAKRSKMKS
jgi:hypothetical protein